MHCTCSTPFIKYGLLVHSLICTNYITEPRFDCYHICYWLYLCFLVTLQSIIGLKTSESEPAPCPEVWVSSHMSSNLCLGDSKPCQLLHEIGQEVWVRIAVIGS